MMEHKKMSFSPCEGCTRVKDPANCENKHCGQWRNWFLKQWSHLRGYPRRMMDSLQAQISPGEDPCTRCGSPKDLCCTPCRARQAWNKEKGAEGL